jgi:hypothetical protein
MVNSGINFAHKNTPAAETELAALLTALSSYELHFSDEASSAHCSLDRWKEMLKPQTLRPLFIVNPCFFLLHWGGLSSIKPYLVLVFQNFGLGEAASWTTVTSL